MADSKAVRRYQASIERALALFDTTNEWADYIAFLSRLLKSLQGPPENAEIPLKSTIARHLAQCLRPSLPSGVHQKALEVYDAIFSIIGQHGLSKDLTLYLPGLSHTLSFASLTTRPQFLAIYDDHILVLPATALRPAIRALLMSLLPGIEEETSEDFEKTLATFNRLRKIFLDDDHEEVFWQNLFLASITNLNRRAGVLVYLSRYLPKMPSRSLQRQSSGGTQPLNDAIKAIVNPEPGLLIRCFATGLQDSQPLIQRGFLDLLVSHLPLDAGIFANDAYTGDLDILVNASAAIVLRRDMGLNRRLWTWYTGSETKTSSTRSDSAATGAIQSPTLSKNISQSTTYFTLFGLASLIRSISSMLESTVQEPAQRARPFRIALSLMDRSEIGGPVVESQFIPLLRSLQSYQATAPSQGAFDEVFRSANVFFDGVESRLITSQLLSLLEKRDLDLVTFIITNFNLEDEDMTRNHIPLICAYVAESIRHMLINPIHVEKSPPLLVMTQLGRVLEDLLVLVPVGVLNDRHDCEKPSKDLKTQILQCYTRASFSIEGSNQTLVIKPDAIAGTLLECTYECLQMCLNRPEIDNGLMGYLFASMDQCIALTDGFRTLEKIQIMGRLLQNIQLPPESSDTRHYQMLTGMTRLVATLYLRDPLQGLLNLEDLCSLVPSLVKGLWEFLPSCSPQYHVEAVESIWRLHALSRSLRLAESTIISLLISGIAQANSREDCVQRFGTLWIHSRLAAKQIQSPEVEQRASNTDDILDLLQHPLLQIIDAMDGGTASHPCTLWMKSLTSLNTLFGVVFQQMPRDLSDASYMSVTLQRLAKLINLTRANEAHWKAFTGKSGYRDAVLELCSSLTSNQALVNSLGVEALQIVRLMIENNGIELGDDILKMLSTRLVASYHMENFQDSLLDTLHTAFSSNISSSQPDYLIPILLDGISSPNIDATLDKWITLLCTIVPLLGTSTLSSNLLKITSCLCKRVDLYFYHLQNNFALEVKKVTNGIRSPAPTTINPERSISNLLSGMEYVLARAHNQASLPRNDQESGLKSPTTDLPSSRSSANDHLTVVLCMQDVLKVCSKLWFWRTAGKTSGSILDTKSLHYMASRLRGRSRRILENLVEAEPQECLETLMGLWVEKRSQNSQHYQVLELLQTLDGARPKFMMPATFNAIYTRTNPNALDQSQKSSLSVNVNAIELIAFLNDYTNALEDDLLEEIWTDCTTFMKEVLSNPMPHRQILFKLLEFTAVLCRKMENTNFGEELRMRKELADLSARLFTAIFTIKPQGMDGSIGKSTDIAAVFGRKRSYTRSSIEAGNALQILQETLPDLSLVLTQSDRLATVYAGIATYISGPQLHSKSYPQNITAELLALLQTISNAPTAVKAWKKDVSDAFNDNRFFQSQVDLVELGWLPLIRQLAIVDKTVVSELLSRLLPPAAAGLMFGVGASAARTEADKKTQFTLRRVALLLLSAEIDFFASHLAAILAKLEELLTATPESSPSSNSKADIYLLLRAILLTFSQAQLSALWPLIDSELRDLCTTMITKDLTRFTLAAQLQGSKLLDVLLLMKPDEFQLHEWLFVTDTMDAIYPSHNLQPVALADQITLKAPAYTSDAQQGPFNLMKKPWLCTDDSRDEQKIEPLLAAFFTHLSIKTFEDSYSLQQIDVKACRGDLIDDLFSE